MFHWRGVSIASQRVLLSTEVPVTRKLKPVDIELDARIQDAVLGVPLRRVDGSLATVGTLIAEASEALRKANGAIKENALIQLTASHLMKQEKRRGNPTILVRLDGSVVLRINYEDGEPEPEAHLKATKLPSLGQLRIRAKSLGVDISDLGRRKIKIIERLDRAESSQDGDRPPR